MHLFLTLFVLLYSDAQAIVGKFCAVSKAQGSAHILTFLPSWHIVRYKHPFAAHKLNSLDALPTNAKRKKFVHLLNKCLVVPTTCQALKYIFFNSDYPRGMDLGHYQFLSSAQQHF